MVIEFVYCGEAKENGKKGALILGGRAGWSRLSFLVACLFVCLFVDDVVAMARAKQLLTVQYILPLPAYAVAYSVCLDAPPPPLPSLTVHLLSIYIEGLSPLVCFSRTTTKKNPPRGRGVGSKREKTLSVSLPFSSFPVGCRLY
jgi:hypothetical protein